MEKTTFNYIDVLNEQYESRSSKNSNYSMRAYARDLELSSSRLSQLLSKKKGLSEQAADILATKLGLSAREKEFFILSAQAQHSRSLKAKSEASKALSDKLRSVTNVKQLALQDLEQVHNWYHMAIFELIELKDCDHTVEWFSRKLKLQKAVVKSALARLEKIGWLVCEEGIYTATFPGGETGSDIPSATIKKYHEEILMKAGQSLFIDDIKEREFLNMTLAFSQEQIDEAKLAIRNFQKEFADKFYPKDVEKKDSVYQLSVQLFRLDSNLEKLGELK